MFQLSEGWDYNFLILRRRSLQFSILRRLRLHFLILRTLRLQTSEVSSSWKTNCSEEITKCSLTVASWISWWWWWWMMITRPSKQCKFCFFLRDRYFHHLGLPEWLDGLSGQLVRLVRLVWWSRWSRWSQWSRWSRWSRWSWWSSLSMYMVYMV